MEFPMKIKNAACYSFSLNGQDPLAHLRLTGPLGQSGINIVNGIENNQIIINRVSESDMVILQREIPRSFDDYEKIIKIARREEKLVVFDLDDILLYLPEDHPDRQSTVFGSSLLPMFQALMEADLVTVSTSKLRDILFDYNDNIAVLPNCFDDNLWRLKPPVLKTSENEILTIGYMGGNSHKPDLEYITPVLLDLIERYPKRIHFHFFGVQPPVEIASLTQVKWTLGKPYTYKDFSIFFQTQTADIFIAPLIDNLFNRCKSPIKFFEYSALGIPGVFSQLETYTDLINHGDNGLLASSLDEWTNCLIQLIEDKELRFHMAKNAQETIRSNWLLSQNAFLWKETFQRNADILTSKSDQNSSVINIVESINLQLFETFNKKQAEEQTQMAEVTVLTMKVAEKEMEVAEKEQVLQSITNSAGWKMLNIIQGVRLKLAPLGSRRERWLRRGVHAAFYLKQHGVRELFHHVVARLIHKEGIKSDANKQADLFTIIVQDGKLCSIPVISVVIEKNFELNLPSVKESDVLNWISAQTLRGIEVVIWNSDTGTAVTLGESVRNWDASSFEDLCHNLAGRYLCMASPDLLQRNRAYLESNLIALESEGLAFSVNVFGKPDWLRVHLKNGDLPGNRMLPYLYQVIHKDCACNDFSLDIKNWLMRRPDMPTVVGKIIPHTTAFPDADYYPTDTALIESVEWSLKGNYILARINAQIPWESLTHVVHPVTTVIPAIHEPSILPTIIIFMPFLAVGGAERLVLQLIRHLQGKVRFVVVTVEDMDVVLGTTADAFRQLVPFVYTAADFLLPALNFSFLSYLIEYFQAETFYIANGSNLIYDTLTTLRQHYPGLRIVDQVYDHQFGWINRYDQTTARAIDACISANPNITQAYVNHGVRSERIHFVEHAINLDDVNPVDYPTERQIQIKKKLGLPLKKKLITFCARLHPQKRPLDFIELARRFTSEKNIHFLMVGDGPLATAVEKQIERIGLKNITRCKFYTPISDIYAITDVMVLPSEYEAMPLVILESLAMGKPVVATDVGHIRDVVSMTHGGVVVPNIGDVTALRMGVLKMLHEPVDSAAMRQILEQRFGVSHIAQQYLRVWMGEAHA